jgi:hypothetical protein
MVILCEDLLFDLFNSDGVQIYVNNFNLNSQNSKGEFKDPK